jgi:hypothetical protein
MASGDDPMIVWAGQGFAPGVRAWYDGDAVAVASPGLSTRDRLAVSGPAEAVAQLVAKVYAEVGTTYRPFGDEHLIRDLADRLPGLVFRAAFGWMDTRTAPTRQVPSPVALHAQPAPQEARSDGLDAPMVVKQRLVACSGWVVFGGVCSRSRGR